MKKLQTSETRTIKRSQIALNPNNPKNHAEKSVKFQKENLRKVGYLGGVVWNERSGNLIDGHRRIMAMDLYYGYDGTPEKDYDVKVEVCNLGAKEEKEQMTYMAMGNTKADLRMVAEYAADIDMMAAGLDDIQIADINALANFDAPDIDAIDLFSEDTDESDSKEENQCDDTKKDDDKYEKGKDNIKKAKAVTKEKAMQRALDENAYITISFTSYKNKDIFCDMFGLNVNDTFIKGEELIEKFGE